MHLTCPGKSERVSERRYTMNYPNYPPYNGNSTSKQEFDDANKDNNNTTTTTNNNNGAKVNMVT